MSKWFRPIAQFVASTLTVWMTFIVLGSHGQFAYIWPLTGVQLSIALWDWRDWRSRCLQLAACWAGEVLATQLLGMPLWVGACMALVEVGEVSFAAAILYPHVARFDDLKKRKNVLRFGIVALLAPALLTPLAAVPISVLVHVSPWTAWMVIAPSDALGIAIILPALLFLYGGEYRSWRRLLPHLRIGIPALLFLIGASLVIFSQDSMPFLFLIFPPLIFALFVWGLEGATFASAAVGIVGGWFTAHGHGPIWLIRGATPEGHIFVFQLFLGTIVAVAMPVGALLDERTRAGRSAKEGESINRNLIQNAADMIVLSTLDGSRRFVSRAVQQVTGWTDTEYLGLGRLGGIHPEDRDQARTIIDSLASGKTEHTFRHRVLCKDGGFRWVETVLRGYTDSDSGDISGYVATVRDLSERMADAEAWSAEKEVLAKHNRRLSELAMRDELTGIANRRAFNLILEGEFSRHSRSKTPLTLLIIDVDFFKKYNDALGHPAGDRCLRQLAQTLESRVRRLNDRVARIGGEEFAAILPETDEIGARTVGDDLLDAVRALEIEHPESPFGRVTVSIGVVTMRPPHGVGSAMAMQLADRALYESKRAGRNCLTVAKV